MIPAHASPTIRPSRRRLLSRGWAFLLAAFLVLLLGSGIAYAQRSFAFDLACRGVLTSGGGVNVYPSTNVLMVGALGQPVAGASQGPTVGVYGGYLHSNRTPVTTSSDTLQLAPNDVETTVSLPFISSFIRVIRGGC